MRFAIASLALLIPAASAAEAPPPPEVGRPAAAARICRDAFRIYPARPVPKAELRRLDELPPADLTLAVLDKVGRCLEPRVVRHGIAGGR